MVAAAAAVVVVVVVEVAAAAAAAAVVVVAVVVVAFTCVSLQNKTFSLLSGIESETSAFILRRRYGRRRSRNTSEQRAAVCTLKSEAFA